MSRITARRLACFAAHSRAWCGSSGVRRDGRVPGCSGGRSPSLSEDEDDDEPATEKAADAIATTIAGTELAKRDKRACGQAIHYALGIGLGVAYGVAAEFRPAVTVGHGIGFGLVTATLLDEAAVPAVGLGDLPWNAGLSSNLYAYASHLVFGGTTSSLVGTSLLHAHWARLGIAGPHAGADASRGRHRFPERRRQ